MAKMRNDLGGEVDNDFKKERKDFVVVSVLVAGDREPRIVYARLAPARFNGTSLTVFGRYGKDGRDRTLLCESVEFRSVGDVKKLFGANIQHPRVKIKPA